MKYRYSKWSAFFILLLAVSFCWQKAVAQCGAPAGATFTESFGDSSSVCWAGGPTGCNQAWQATGANYSITPPPVGTPPGTACTHALSLAASSTPAQLETYGTIPNIPAGTTLDLYFSFYVVSAPRSYVSFVQLMDAGSDAILAQLVWKNANGSTFLYATGATSSANIGISLNSWHSIQVHIDAVAANSYVIVDGGSQQIFAAKAQSVNDIVIHGDASGSYYVANLYVNSAGYGPTGAPMLTDFAGATNGAMITTAAMNAGSHCVNNSGWEMSDSPMTGMVFSNAEVENLHTSVSTCNGNYSGDTGMSVRFDLSTSQNTTYWFNTVSPSTSVGFFYKITAPATNTTYYCSARLTGLLDYACINEHGNGSHLQLYLEVNAAPELYGGPITISPNTWYWITIQYNAGGTHHLRVYETQNWSLIGASDGPATANYSPLEFDFGHSGSDLAPAGTYLYFSNIELDWVTAKFPLGPGGGDIPSSPAIVSANNTNFVAGAAGSFTVSATGSPTPALSETGALPSGVSFDPSSGLLRGTPTASVSATYPLQFTATNSLGSTVQDFTLNVSLGQTATPTFTPAGGSYTVSQIVSISDATAGAVIYYTVDGSTPTTSSTPYVTPIPVSGTTTLKAIAVAPGYSGSPIASANYALQVPKPTFNPAAGSYSSPQSATISDAAPGAAIYYTTDGSTPTTSSALYNGAVPISNTTTLKAMAALAGWSNSTMGSATYTITVQPPATPTFSLRAGTYTTTQTITISDSTAGATIYYTTDGSTPNASSAPYAGPLSVAQTATIKAIASTGGQLSAVASSTYTLRAATPVLSPVGGTYSSARSVTISDSTPGVSIFYTTDGSTPATSSTLYSGPVAVSKTTTLTAIAALGGWSNSAAGSATYTITIPPPATPTFSPKAGTYTTTQTVTLSDFTAGASIYYTTDGSTPTTASTPYAGPFSVTQTTTIRTMASSGGSSSPIASNTYTLRVGTPALSPAGGTYNSVQSVTISDPTPGASIFYTTNGSTPTTSSTLYTGPVSVAQITTIKAISVLPGWSNSSVASATYTLKVPSPTFTPAAGTYTGTQSVAISAPLPGVSIYYTVNGSTPTTSSMLYTSPISISATRTIRAIAAVPGWSNSSAASATYTIH